jgi:2-iminoacetate synthase
VGYHLYQETYDVEAYFAAHRGGPKRDMAYRLDAPRRALAAGFEAVGLGVLLGLGPARADLAALVAHARLLEGAFPRAQLGFSLPRWQPAQAVPELAGWPVSDEELCALFLFLRLELPRAHLTLTTRESEPLRDRLLPLGLTKLSAGVSTSPGGYSGAEAVPQFHIQDRRSLSAVAARVRAAGLTPTLE